jgi:hexosaminidase
MKKILLICVLGALLLACSQEYTKEVKIIPRPLELIENDQVFTLDKHTNVVFETDNEAVVKVKTFFLRELSRLVERTVQQGKEVRDNNQIKILFNDSLDIESYILKVTEKNIVIESSSYGGVIYALQSLKQLILVNNVSIKSKVYIPGVSIKDSPAFAWRGFMLDVVRHMQSVDELKKVLDYMADLKLNVFHMHLSDDQGFRMEIESYPLLNEIGSWRVDYNTSDENINAYWGRPEQQEGEKATYGGYYTKKQLKELIQYAAERNIQILPEIDVPGHARAIIASYPELSCSQSKTYVATGWSRLNNTLCPSNEACYELMDSLIAEVAEVFPMPYIHIGGDECYRHYWEEHAQCQDFMRINNLKDARNLQSYFIHRMEEIVSANGKEMIGWDEILDGGLAPNATVMSWRGEEGGIKAAQMNHDVIMSPASYHYFDFKQGQSSYEPNLGYAQSLLSKVYAYQVIPEALNKDQEKYILGTQANLWTESISDWSKLTYMVFPRLYALAENAWTHNENKNWDDFINRLKFHLDLMDQKGIRHAKSVFNPWLHHEGNGKEIKVWFSSEITDPVIRYTLDGSLANGQSAIFTDTLRLHKTTDLQAAIFDGDKLLGQVIQEHFIVHKAAGSEVRLIKGDTESDIQSITDLCYGELLQAGDEHWVQMNTDCLIEITLNKPQDINKVMIHSLRHTLHGLYGIARFEVFAEMNGQFKKVGDTGKIGENYMQGRNIMQNSIECELKEVRKIQVKLYKVDPIPEKHAAGGKESYMKIDEIVVL